MKNILIQNYNLKKPKMYYSHNHIYIVDEKEKYELVRINYNKEINNIYEIIYNNKIDYYNEIVKDRNKNIVLYHKGITYILIKMKRNKMQIPDILEEEIKKNIIIMNNDINRKNWSYLWKKKNDHIENNHFMRKGESKLIDESMDYFLGMAENAVAYIQQQVANNKTNLTIAHRRINDIENPLNIIIDEKERDIGEYLKYIFYQNRTDNKTIEKLLTLIDEGNLSYEKIYARMLYPTYYFDLCEQIEKNNQVETHIKKVINRIDEYEQYLNKIYKIFFKEEQTKNIDWLN